MSPKQCDFIVFVKLFTNKTLKAQLQFGLPNPPYNFKIVINNCLNLSYTE